MTAWAVLAAAATMGLLGSLHCSAMCGPLAAAGTSGGSRARAIAGYLGGRLVAYATVGAVLGQLGQHALCRLPMQAAENVVVALTALPAAIHGVRLLTGRRPAKQPLVPLRKRRASGLLDVLASLMPRRGLALGLATALLPCGLLWSAWALAAASARPELGALAMATLAVTSVPGLLLPIVGADFVRRRFRASTRWEGLLWCALALFLALRPLWVEAHCAMPSTAEHAPFPVPGALSPG